MAVTVGQLNRKPKPSNWQLKSVIEIPIWTGGYRGLTGVDGLGARVMTPKTAGNKYWFASKSLSIAGLSLAFCASALTASAQQDQPTEGQASAQQQDSPAQGQPDTQTQAQPSQPLPPQMLTLPAGTVVRVRVDEWLSSDRSLPGDSFSAVLDQPIVVNGWVAARRGQAQTGRVSVAKKAGRVKGTSQLGVELPELTLVDGQQLPVQTQMLESSAGTSNGRDAVAIGSTTGAGAAIGAIAEGGAGAAIGAGAGAAAGIIGVLVTRGKPTDIPPETVLSFRLQSPVTISTENSQFAFQPVTQADYDSHVAESRPRLARHGAPVPPPPYYYGYPYAWGYPYFYPFYPGTFFGFYGSYGRFGHWRR
jgi:hypothetical protein